jgi:3-oxoacyl-[acyl-carrier-protein] synthase-3
MRVDSVYVAGAASWLPPTVAVADAVAAGWIPAERAEVLQYESITVADGPEGPPEMAVAAAGTALRRAGVPAGDVGQVIHSSLNFQGVDWWPAGSYIADRAVGPEVPAFELLQRCNGGMAALEAGVRHLAADPAGPPAVLLTTGDRFDGPHVDRWNVQDINLYADGGSAMVLSRRGGFARILSVASRAENRVEAAMRGDLPFVNASRANVDYPERMREWSKTEAAELDLIAAIKVLYRQVLDQVLTESGVNPGGIDWTVLQATGRTKLHMLIGVPEERTTWEFARRVGHIGPGDLTAGLAYLVESGKLEPGQRVLLLGGGGGYTCTMAVLEILDTPNWAPTAPWTRTATDA